MNIIPGTGSSVSPGAGTGGDGSPGAVLYASEQTLTDPQKAQARTNIGGAAASDLSAEEAARIAGDETNETAILNEVERASAAEGAEAADRAAADSAETAARIAGDEALDTAKADKITGGTTDNLVSRDSGGNIADSSVAKAKVVTADADLGLDEIVLGAAAGTKKGKTTGVKIAPANSVAGALEVMRGGDVRVNAAGGMDIQGNHGPSSTQLIDLSTGDFSIVVTRKQFTYSTATLCLIGQDDGGLAVTVANGTDISLSRTNQAVLHSFTGVLSAAHPFWTDEAGYDEFTFAAGVFTMKHNGDVVCVGAVARTGVTPKLFSPFGGYANIALPGIRVRGRHTNFALTDDEAAGAAKGESRGRLAFAGWSPVSTGSPALTFGDGVLSAGSGTGFTYTVNTTQGFVNIPWQSVGDGVQEVALSFAATGTGVVYAGTDGISTPFVAGDNAVTVLRGASTISQVSFRMDTTGTISALKSNLNGTVADYRPENCLASNGWVDASENCYDLVAVGGAEALNPIEAYTRRFSVTTGGATITSATVASVGTLTAATDGRSSAVIAALRTGDMVGVSPGATWPANATAPFAKVTGAATLAIHAGALGGNAVIGGGTVLELTQILK